MATQLDNILVKNKHCNYELLYKKKPKVWRELHGFGEICICSNLDNMSSKIKNKGDLAMMEGFHTIIHHLHIDYLNLKLNLLFIVET